MAVIPGLIFGVPEDSRYDAVPMRGSIHWDTPLEKCIDVLHQDVANVIFYVLVELQYNAEESKIDEIHFPLKPFVRIVNHHPACDYPIEITLDDIQRSIWRKSDTFELRLIETDLSWTIGLTKKMIDTPTFPYPSTRQLRAPFLSKEFCKIRGFWERPGITSHVSFILLPGRGFANIEVELINIDEPSVYVHPKAILDTIEPNPRGPVSEKDIQAQQIIDEADEALIHLASENIVAENEPPGETGASQSSLHREEEVPTEKKDNTIQGSRDKENVRPRRDLNSKRVIDFVSPPPGLRAPKKVRSPGNPPVISGSAEQLFPTCPTDSESEADYEKEKKYTDRWEEDEQYRTRRNLSTFNFEAHRVIGRLESYNFAFHRLWAGEIDPTTLLLKAVKTRIGFGKHKSQVLGSILRAEDLSYWSFLIQQRRHNVAVELLAFYCVPHFALKWCAKSHMLGTFFGAQDPHSRKGRKMFCRQLNQCDTKLPIISLDFRVANLFGDDEMNIQQFYTQNTLDRMLSAFRMEDLPDHWKERTNFCPTRERLQTPSNPTELETYRYGCMIPGRCDLCGHRSTPRDREITYAAKGRAKGSHLE